MAKKNWCSLLKRLFILDTNSKREKKEKRRRWVFGKLKIKRLASFAAPPPSGEKIPSEAEEGQSKHNVTVAIATAAAVGAAQVAADVVGLTSTPQFSHQCEEKTKIQELSVINIQFDPPLSTQQHEREIQVRAATKIQTAFRGYLARKALRALKGLVRLQAIIKGRAVRRQAITTLKRLQSIVNIQTQVCARRSQMVEGTMHCQENKELQDLRAHDIKIDLNSQRRCNDSILSKVEANSLFSSEREAAIKRDQLKEYSFSHRRSTESEQNKANERLRYWLEQWVDTELAKREDLQNLDTVLSSSSRNKEEFGSRQFKLRNSQKQHHIEGPDPIYVPRRSFHHKKQHSIGHDNSFTASPVVPTYMAATQSAKAKARSVSSPRLRPISLDTFSDTNSPYKHKLSPISSINSEVTSCSKISNPGGGFSQRSPCLKGLPRPVKCALPNWDRHGHGSFR